MFRHADNEYGVFAVSDNVLFFGCRGKNSDFYCEDFWQELVQRNMLKLSTAFSRDQVHMHTRTHAQHSNLRIKPHSDDVLSAVLSVHCLIAGSQSLCAAQDL